MVLRVLIAGSHVDLCWVSELRLCSNVVDYAEVATFNEALSGRGSLKPERVMIWSPSFGYLGILDLKAKSCVCQTCKSDRDYLIDGALRLVPYFCMQFLMPMRGVIVPSFHRSYFVTRASQSF